jgi:2-polyprenyl-6-methoxyphenol hydroxylase-like FAD-dependent oxidoreductase
MNTKSHDVVIVGAGPTGLALGAELSRLGISSFIMDKQHAGANTSRAAVIHARTLEVLQPLDATTELLSLGVIVPFFRIRDRDRVLATIDFRELKTSYPFTLMCPQNLTEEILLRRLEGLGGTVHRPCEVETIQAFADDVEVRFRDQHGLQTVRAKWLVGCDGMHSIVREQAAIPFKGGAYDEDFVLADVEMDWALGRDEVNLFFSEKGLVVVAPLPKGRFRIVATVNDDAENFQQILDERGPRDRPGRIREIVWTSRFHIQHRVARSLLKGRILLAGDAAHVHSPAGGQGMNTGIQDGVSLATALQRTLSSGDDKALDEWQARRLKVAHDVVTMTDRITKAATTSSSSLKLFRNVVIELIGHIPAAQQALAKTLSEVRYR